VGDPPNKPAFSQRALRGICRSAYPYRGIVGSTGVQLGEPISNPGRYLDLGHFPGTELAPRLPKLSLTRPKGRAVKLKERQRGRQRRTLVGVDEGVAGRDAVGVATGKVGQVRLFVELADIFPHRRVDRQRREHRRACRRRGGSPSARSALPARVPITLRHGARVIEDSRRLRLTWSDKGRQGGADRKACPTQPNQGMSEGPSRSIGRYAGAGLL
jgi:hypothetical protein